MLQPSAQIDIRPKPLPEIALRRLESQSDFAACVQLQIDTWGSRFADCVPTSLLKVSQKVGGVCAGAFTPDGRLLAFVFGLTGVRQGQLIHWSHMLAVHRDYRDCGVGRRLKEYQRELVRELGIETIYWTFDPLVARNAHLNLNRLGTQVCEYAADMYHETGSQLHAFGTDRLVVAWPVTLTDGPKLASPAGVAWRSAPVAPGIEAAVTEGAQVIAKIGESGALLRIEVPSDVEAIPVSQARAWRAATRPMFLHLMARGYRVIGFFTDERNRCFYVLEREGNPIVNEPSGGPL